MADVDATTLRYCPRCMTDKALSDFSTLKSGRPNGYCKKCRSELAKEWAARNRERREAYNREYRSKNIEQLREYDRLRANEPERKAARRVSIDRWQKKNPDRVRASMRRHDAKRAPRKAEYFQCHKDEYRKRNAAWQAANPDKARGHWKKYRESHPDQVRANDRNNKARRRGAAEKHTAADIAMLFERQQGLCAYDGVPLVISGPRKYHVDHDIPLTRGGSNGPENLVLACPGCNLRKHTLTGTEFRALRAQQAA